MTTQLRNLYVKWYVDKPNTILYIQTRVIYIMLDSLLFLLNSISFYVKPEGGVIEGQIILSPLPNTYHGPRIKAPTGRWKDELYCVCDEGVCHPSFCCSFLCPIFALGQVMSRMQVNWLGSTCSHRRVSRTFDVVIVFLLLDCIFYRISFGPTYYDSNALITVNLGIGSFLSPLFGYVERLLLWAADEQYVSTFLWYIRPFALTMLLFWKVYTTARTRRTVRERYQIPEVYCCSGCEDACCSMWCWCFTTAQMLRHTGEYETYSGVCCSSTGHQPGVPLVV